MAVDEIKSISVEISKDYRWERYIKSTSLLANVMLKNQARKRGYDDAILSREGCLTESTSSNIFLAKGNVVFTPEKSNLFLHGITRDMLITFITQTGFTVEERVVLEEEIFEADEIWLTSSGRTSSSILGWRNPSLQ